MLKDHVIICCIFQTITFLCYYFTYIDGHILIFPLNIIHQMVRKSGSLTGLRGLPWRYYSLKTVCDSCPLWDLKLGFYSKATNLSP